MFKKLILSTAMLLISIAILGHAQSSMTFEASIDYPTRIVTISGTVQEGGSWISLYVEGPTNRLEYIGNTTVENNAYSVSFEMLNPVVGEYRVKIKAEGMDTPPLNESFNYTLPLSAPVLLSPQESDITSNTVNLSWNGAQGGAGDITYSVYVNENLYIDNISGTSYTVQNLSPQTQYDFKIIAKDSYQAEAVSNVISVTTEGSMTFQASIDYLTKIVTIFGNVEGSASWVSLYVEGPTNRLEYIGNTTVENNAYSVSFELPDPVVGEYRVKIKAENMDAPLSEIFTYTSPPLIAPILSQPVDGDITDTTVSLSWDAAQGGTGYITYSIYVNDNLYVDNISGTSYTVENLSPQTQYDFKLIAKDSSQAEAVSIVLSVTTNESVVVGDSNTIQIDCVEHNTYNVIVVGKNITNLSTKVFSLDYDPLKLEVVDLCSLTHAIEIEDGNITGTDIEITEFDSESGLIKFKLNKTFEGKQWTGVVNGIRFRALASSGVTTITQNVD